MESNDQNPRNRLNTRTFAIRQGDRIYVTVPVLVYEPGDDTQRAGLTYMASLFTDDAVAPFQAIEISGSWCTLDPHNSNVRDPHNSNVNPPPQALPKDPHNSNLNVDSEDGPNDF